MLAITERALIEIFSRIFSRNHPNFKYQIIPTGFDPRYGPPPEHSPDPDSIQLRYLPLLNFARYLLRVRGQVVVRRERELARAAEIDDEVAGCLVQSVLLDRSGKETNRETIVYKLDFNDFWGLVGSEEEGKEKGRRRQQLRAGYRHVVLTG
ncbi:stromelysin-1 [Corchorus olitorius]|uniref:Stromelysin-1 n=1 Tax=Corchorus olitorius TaxID=93759 RepID=A0A1R3GJ31_9ROSI|nr:stromelysin-1 [Corchorus olitorius]